MRASRCCFASISSIRHCISDGCVPLYVNERECTWSGFAHFSTFLRLFILLELFLYVCNQQQFERGGNKTRFARIFGLVRHETLRCLKEITAILKNIVCLHKMTADSKKHVEIVSTFTSDKSAWSLFACVVCGYVCVCVCVCFWINLTVWGKTGDRLRLLLKWIVCFALHVLFCHTLSCLLLQFYSRPVLE